VKAKVSTKGQVVIPYDIRKRLGIHPGDEVTINGSEEQIIIMKVPAVIERPRLKLAKGKMPKRAEPLTPEMVKEIAQL
jgi:AbrB family looped-hinge helix DNA binding protein